MASITVAQAEEYLSIHGAVMTPDADDRVWLLLLASAYRNGFITGFDWDTKMGANIISLIEDVYPEYEKWKKDQAIDPDLFMRD